MTRTEAAYCILSGSYDFSDDSEAFVRDGHVFFAEELEKYRQLANDGYTLWLDGGECPVDEDVMVEAVLSACTKPCRKNAGFYRWTQSGGGGDIIAYLVVEDETKDSGAFGKVAHYTDETGADLIDDFARYRTKEQFRGAMMFVLEKYMRRLGKKDDVFEEVEKIAKYSNRWLEYERKLK